MLYDAGATHVAVRDGEGATPLALALRQAHLDVAVSAPPPSLVSLRHAVRYQNLISVRSYRSSYLPTLVVPTDAAVHLKVLLCLVQLLRSYTIIYYNFHVHRALRTFKKYRSTFRNPLRT